MNNKIDALSELALQFFGTMTASISHEMNNVLAIINENAGLLEDIALMSDKGIAIDAERVKNLAGKIMTQIGRANMITKKMNQFAHSVDDSIKRVDLGDLLELVAALSNRFAAMRGVTLDLRPQAYPVNITTNAFYLEHLLWICLDFAMNATDQNKVVALSVESVGTSAVIRFSGIEETEGGHGMISHLTGNDCVLGVVKGKLDIDLEAGDILLILPFDITTNSKE